MEGRKRRQSVSLMVILMMIMIMQRSMKGVHGQKLSPSECKEENRLLTNRCRPVVFGQPISAACCQRVRISNFECLCQMVTPKFASLLSVNQAIKILRVCGRRVPLHFKCGSWSFP